MKKTITADPDTGGFVISVRGWRLQFYSHAEAEKIAEAIQIVERCENRIAFVAHFRIGIIIGMIAGFVVTKLLSA
jgi:hypothetical protein